MPETPISKSLLKTRSKAGSSVRVGHAANLRRRSREFTRLIRPSFFSTSSGLKRSRTKRASNTPRSKPTKKTPTKNNHDATSNDLDATSNDLGATSNDLGATSPDYDFFPSDHEASAKLPSFGLEESALQDIIKSQEELISQLQLQQTENEKKILNYEKEIKENEKKYEEQKFDLTLMQRKLDFRDELVLSGQDHFGRMHGQLESLNKKHVNSMVKYERLKEKSSYLDKEIKRGKAQIAKLQEVEDGLRSDLRNSDLQLRKLLNDAVDLRGQIRVAVRVRPLINDEQCGSLEYPTPFIIRAGSNEEATSYKYLKVYGPTTTQRKLFEDVEELVHSCLHGYNVSLICFGQPGSGKTYTMIGGSDDQEGLIPRAAKCIFQRKNELSGLGWEFDFKGSFLEIYMEEVYDLLNNRQKIELKIESGTCVVSGVVKTTIDSEEDITYILNVANQYDSAAATNCNDTFTGKHRVLRVHIEARNDILNLELNSVLSFVEKSASRVDKTQTPQPRCGFHKLSAFETCIRTQLLSEPVPYRDSKLTTLLMDSLGAGNSKTLVIVGISPASAQEEETKNSLEFATQMSITKLGAVIKKQQ